MSDSKYLFDTLRSFKDPDPLSSSEERFLEYCRSFLKGVERLHFDYKEKQDRRSSTLGERDKKNLAKAVSGFANAGGGVLIWGLEDNKLNSRPIHNVSHFLSDLISRSSQVTDPPVPNIDGDFIPINDSPTSEGYAILHIPESPLPPHRVILKETDIRGRYYFRTGDSFIEATHTQLEDMFGRRPRPILSLKSRISVRIVIGRELELEVYIEIANSGRAIAKYPYLAVDFKSPHKINYHGAKIRLRTFPSPPNTTIRAFGGGSDDVIHPSTTLFVFPIKVETTIDETADDIPDIKFSYQISAEGITPISDEFELSGLDIHRFVQEYIAHNNNKLVE